MKSSMLFLLCFLVASCNRDYPEYTYLGKWAGLSYGEYNEGHITSETIYSFNCNVGEQTPIGYTVKGDSLVYNIYGMTVRYQMISDSVLVVSNSDFSDTLYRLENSIVTYDEIEQSDTAALRQYVNGFFERAVSFYNKFGYEDYWGFDRNEKDTLGVELILDELKSNTPNTK